MLALDGLRAGYGAVPVLHGVDLELAASECAAVLGRNGAGKTTLMRAITGAIASTGGSIALDGTDLRSLKAYERARLGISSVPQGRDIFPKLTVLENLRVGTATRRQLGGDAVEEVLARFPTLDRRRHDRGGRLSGGQQQLLALARALVAAPRLLLLDEPSEGIQPSVLDEIAQAVSRIDAEGGVAVLVVEQNLDFAARIARRALIMEKGEIIAEATTAELLADRALHRKYLAL
ncbi:ABC transporter ATP-binding protein [Candidatus Poriferisodalis sp.]|uniref:ABC transporter ATP-binding protein n=1 Tax=Candidatus Poriferisodalis sp. TaxID=3101277 RepID=UPI003B017DF7